MPTLIARVPASKEKLFTILAAYEEYPEWTPDVVECAVLAREGDIVVAEFFSPELVPEKYQLEFVHSKPTSITYKQIDQYDSRGISGGWRLADSPDGGGTVVTGEIRLKTSFWQNYRNRTRSLLVLQRRLEVLSQMFTEPSCSVVKPGLFDESRLLETMQRGEDVVVIFGGGRYLIRKVR